MTKRSEYFIVSVAFLTIFYILSGCGGSARKRVESSGDISAYEDVDPFSLDDEFAALVPDSTVEPSEGAEQSGDVDTYWNVSRENGESSDSGSDSNGTRYDQADEAGGYRIQIGIFADHNDAETVASKARAVISHNVYVVFEEPFYRVRVGDFRSKRAVEKALREVRSKGYKDAIWIRSEINE